jgi:hypothetical protein
MEPFVGLRNLKSSRKRAVDWVDLGHIVTLLSKTEEDGYKVCPLKGLGQFMSTFRVQGLGLGLGLGFRV